MSIVYCARSRCLCHRWTWFALCYFPCSSQTMAVQRCQTNWRRVSRGHDKYSSAKSHPNLAFSKLDDAILKPDSPELQLLDIPTTTCIRIRDSSIERDVWCSSSIATRPTMVLKNWKMSFNLVVFDEAHHTSCQRLLRTTPMNVKGYIGQKPSTHLLVHVFFSVLVASPLHINPQLWAISSSRLSPTITALNAH